KGLEEHESLHLEEVINNSFDMSKGVHLHTIKLAQECIAIDCNHSLTHAEISIQTNNQRGLLAFVMSCFETLSINVITAKIHSSKHKVKDSFLIEKQNNLCDNTDKIYNLLLNKEV
ncbi:MAG: phosphohydrolase, partial [Pseudomonadota bacterium]|nr:phosphohydrolase [Pseudomonadota bacterium]